MNNMSGVMTRLLMSLLRCTLGRLPRVRALVLKTCVLLEKERDTEASLRWLFEAHRFIEEGIDQQAVAWGRGVHIKHELMTGIHTFFYDRIPLGSSVLDVGCGVGVVAHAIAAQVQNVRVVGMDLNADHIRFARERFTLTNLRFLEGDVTRDLPHEVFDTIVLSSVLEHIVNRVALLLTLVAKYRPARILIRVPTCERHYHVLMKRRLGLFPYVDADHKTEYSLATFFEEMAAASLTVATVETRWGDIWATCRPFAVESGVGALPA
ncbi:MAG: hypothetical protein BWK76_13280 [Desulfobulbaceae bacterium A2]|nr:MAG: hypothetical protein BWK76_13280 [Desulfobulbaceae bacterium A2]